MTILAPHGVRADAAAAKLSIAALRYVRPPEACEGAATLDDALAARERSGRCGIYLDLIKSRIYRCQYMFDVVSHTTTRRARRDLITLTSVYKRQVSAQP